MPTDPLNPVPPPTTGIALRRFRGEDDAEMLRRVADYLDEANPGRTIIGLWSTASDYGLQFDVVIEYDEDAYEDIPDD